MTTPLGPRAGLPPTAPPAPPAPQPPVSAAISQRARRPGEDRDGMDAQQAFDRFRSERDPALMAAVFDGTAAEVARVARCLAPPGVDPCDLVQDTYVSAMQCAMRRRAGTPLLPWLLGILANHAARARRARRHLTAVDERTDARQPVHELIRAEQCRRFRAAVQSLPEPYRRVLDLRLAGLSTLQIAVRVRCTPGTVRSQQHRALQMLRTRLPADRSAGHRDAVALGSLRARLLGTAAPVPLAGAALVAKAAAASLAGIAALAVTTGGPPHPGSDRTGPALARADAPGPLGGAPRAHAVPAPRAPLPVPQTGGAAAPAGLAAVQHEVSFQVAALALHFDFGPVFSLALLPAKAAQDPRPVHRGTRP